jgi:hypothetical protein
LADLYRHCLKEEVVLPDFVAQYEKELVRVRERVCVCMCCMYACV